MPLVAERSRAMQENVMVEAVWVANAIEWMWTMFGSLGFWIVSIMLLAFAGILIVLLLRGCERYKAVRVATWIVGILIAIMIIGRIGYYDMMDETQRDKESQEVRKIQRQVAEDQRLGIERDMEGNMIPHR